MPLITFNTPSSSILKKAFKQKIHPVPPIVCAAKQKGPDISMSEALTGMGAYCLNILYQGAVPSCRPLIDGRHPA
jgi:hypothetical protein